MASEIISTCIYCGCACKLKYIVENNRIIRVTPFKEPVSRGKPCIKGLTIHEVVDEQRIRTPLIRESKNKDFEPISWDYALQYIKDELEKYEPEDLMFVSSGEITNEDNYVIQKFARIVAQTNNIDNCARLCHAPTVFAYKRMFGNGANPSLMDDVYDLDLLLLAGTNPYSNYPVMFSRIVEARKNGLKVIYLHHVDHPVSKWADLKIIAYPGTEIAIFMYWIKYLIDHGLGKDLDGYEALKQSVQGYDLEFVSKVTGVKKELIQQSAEMILNSERFGFMHGMGLTQQINGTENVMALLNLVHLKNGKVMSLRGKINIQGAGDMLSHPWLDPQVIEMLERAWDHELPKTRGKSLIEAVFTDPVKFMWISSMNPAVSLPHLSLAHERMSKMFIVVSHYVYNYTIEKFANIVLPTPMLIEREGTITNGERRVRYVRRVREFPNAKQEWKILSELAKMFGKEKWFNYKSPKEVFVEITKTIPAYRGIDPEKVYSGEDTFADKSVKYKILYPVDIEGLGFEREEGEFLLISARCPYHFVSGDVTRNSKSLRRLAPEPVVKMNPEDAKKLGISKGDEILIESKVGKQRVKVDISSDVLPGTLVSSFHFDKFLFNMLVPLEFDYETQIPHYKGVRVRIKKLSK